MKIKRYVTCSECGKLEIVEIDIGDVSQELYEELKNPSGLVGSYSLCEKCCLMKRVLREER